MLSHHDNRHFKKSGQTEGQQEDFAYKVSSQDGRGQVLCEPLASLSLILAL